MAEIRTKIYVIRENGKSIHIQKVDLPKDDTRGFFGTVELKLQAGQLTTISIPRQTFTIETMNKEDWEKYFGAISESQS